MNHIKRNKLLSQLGWWDIHPSKQTENKITNFPLLCGMRIGLWECSQGGIILSLNSMLSLVLQLLTLL